MTDPDRILTPVELAGILRISTDTIQRMAARGIIPALPLGIGHKSPVYRFHLGEVLDALKSRQDIRTRSLSGADSLPVTFPRGKAEKRRQA
jgi:hypothetical protein